MGYKYISETWGGYYQAFCSDCNWEPEWKLKHYQIERKGDFWNNWICPVCRKAEEEANQLDLQFFEDDEPEKEVKRFIGPLQRVKGPGLGMAAVREYLRLKKLGLADSEIKSTIKKTLK